MKPWHWFTLASVALGIAVSAIEQGVRAYVNDDKWDKALAAEASDGATAKRE